MDQDGPKGLSFCGPGASAAMQNARSPAPGRDQGTESGRNERRGLGGGVPRRDQRVGADSREASNVAQCEPASAVSRATGSGILPAW